MNTKYLISAWSTEGPHVYHYWNFDLAEFVTADRCNIDNKSFTHADKRTVDFLADSFEREGKYMNVDVMAWVCGELASVGTISKLIDKMSEL